MYPAHMMFATLRKPFWRYLVKELLVVAICASIAFPLAFLAVFAEMYYEWPSGLGLALLLLLFALFYAVKGYRRQE